jgi:5-methyltetrahydropteroyltriglutamate--homocysteine methyltransferase
MKRSQERILTSHAGSLIRPQVIVDYAMAQDRGETVDASAYEEDLSRSVTEVVRQQAEAGVDVVDDGEFSKSSWGTYINMRVTGFERQEGRAQPINYLGRDIQRYPGFYAQSPYGAGLATIPRQAFATDVCVGPITYSDFNRINRDIENLKRALESAPAVEEAFLAVVAPASAAFNAVNDYYRSEEEYVYALAEALRQEYLAITKAGLVVQVDDAVLANAYDHFMQEGGRERYRKWAWLRVEALNHALRGIPEDRVRYHLCYGSWHAPHTADAPLEDIIDLILAVQAQAYSIEAANVRHEHDWRVWQSAKLPAGKILIPGVITHHTLSVEHPRLIADRIVRYARIVGRENVIAGTDCGFAQGVGVQRVHPDIQWAKLESLAEGARLASAELWA